MARRVQAERDRNQSIVVKAKATLITLHIANLGDDDTLPVVELQGGGIHLDLHDLTPGQVQRIAAVLGASTSPLDDEDVGLLKTVAEANLDRHQTAAIEAICEDSEIAKTVNALYEHSEYIDVRGLLDGISALRHMYPTVGEFMESIGPVLPKCAEMRVFQWQLEDALKLLGVY